MKHKINSYQWNYTYIQSITVNMHVKALKYKRKIK